jgi:hypothetical protein
MEQILADQHSTYTKLLLEGSYGEGVQSASIRCLSSVAGQKKSSTLCKSFRLSGRLSHGKLASYSSSFHLLAETLLFFVTRVCCQTKTAETDWLWRNHAVAGFENNIRRRQGDYLGVTLL